MKQWGWILPVLLAACVPVKSLVGKEATLWIYPRVAPSTQAAITPITQASIATLDIIPYLEVSNGVYSPLSSLTGNPTTIEAADLLKLTQASPCIDPNRPIVLRRLKPNRNYRVFARAYNSSNSLISKDTASYVDVHVENDDAPQMAQLPVQLLATSFGATTSVTVFTEGRYDYLKGTLFLPGNIQVAAFQTTKTNPEFVLTNLQGETQYRLEVESYKLGGMVASTSLTLDISNETAPATLSMSLKVPYVATTFAGNGTVGMVDALGTSAQFSTPYGVDLDAAGNLYVADFNNNRIRKVSPMGMVTTLAGNGSTSYVDGTGSTASFMNPHAVVVDTQGNVYVAQYGTHRISKITPAGVMSTFVGNGSMVFAEGTGTAATVKAPTGIALDSQGYVYVADRGNQRIRKITPEGVTSTLAGNGTIGYADGPGSSANFNYPTALTVDLQGNVYVAEWLNHCIRKITPAGNVSTLAGGNGSGYLDGTGTNAKFNTPYGISIDVGGNLYVAEWHNHRIRKVTPEGVVSTLAGNGTSGFAEGPGTSAQFASPVGIKVDGQGILYIGDPANQRIRKLY